MLSISVSACELNGSVVREEKNKISEMILPFVLVTIASLLFVVHKFRKSNSSNESKGKKTTGNYWTLMTAVFNFLFRVKSEDRLNSFKQVHKFFPRYVRMKIFNSDNVVIYDPEICKKVFNAQVACQRPFRNCFQLEYGLLSSECKHIFASHPIVMVVQLANLI